MKDSFAGLSTVHSFSKNTLLNGRYRIEHKLGSGGMGVVYSAWDQEQDMQVALKFVPEVLAQDTGAVVRLKKEASICMTLSNDHIVRLHTLQRDGDTLFLVMEYVNGPTLDRAIAQKGSLSQVDTLLLANEIATGMSYAHNKAVLHRDLKPKNIMFHFTKPIAAAELERLIDIPIIEWPEFIVKITDFGLAIQIRNSMTRLTGTIGTSGTLIYMSPQQLNGMTPDVSDDIYSYGCILYEMLHGAPPFVSGDVMYQIRNVVPPQLTGIDEKIQKIITRCLEKKAELRPATFNCVFKELNRDSLVVQAPKEDLETAVSSEAVTTEDQLEAIEKTTQPVWDELAGNLEELKVKAEKILKSDFQPESWSACDLYLDGKQKLEAFQYSKAIPYFNDAFSEVQTASEKKDIGLILLYTYTLLIGKYQESNEWMKSLSTSTEAVSFFPNSSILAQLHQSSINEDIPDESRSLFTEARELQEKSKYEDAIAQYEKALLSLNSHYASLAKTSIKNCHECAFKQFYSQAKDARTREDWSACLSSIDQALTHRKSNKYLIRLREEALEKYVELLVKKLFKKIEAGDYDSSANDNACILLQQVVQLDTDNSHAQIARQKIRGYFLKSGDNAIKNLDLEKANYCFKKCLELDPGDTETKEKLIQLSRLETIEEKKRTSISVDIAKGIYIELVWIRPGIFTMGSNLNFNDERPPHKIKISKGFWFGKCQVTQGQWKAIMKNNPSFFKDGKNNSPINTLNHPVECVTWFACQEFLSKLSENTGNHFRLPTEAEWEYACKSNNPANYCFGHWDKEGGFLGFGGKNILAEYAWYRKNAGGTSHPVGKKKPNAWGLHDMHGNISEWCHDWYDEKYYKKSPEIDPQGPSNSCYRVYRGGSWANYAHLLISTRRERLPPNNFRSSLGFRVVASSIK